MMTTTTTMNGDYQRKATTFIRPTRNHLSINFVCVCALITVLFMDAIKCEDVIEGMSCSFERTDLYCIANLSNNLISQQFASTSGLRLSKLAPTNQNQLFETIDLVFSDGHINIHDGFFDSIHNLYSGGSVAGTHYQPLQQQQQQLQKTTYDQVPLEFRVKFQNFDYLSLGPKAFSHVFPRYYMNEGRPIRPLHMVVNVYNSRAAETNISSSVFDDLVLTSLTIHNADLSKIPFEQLFKKSRIDVLDLKGSYIPSDNRMPFDGNVDKTILIKQAASLDDNEFPKYPVREYTLIAQNIRTMDGRSLANHDNVKELEIKSRNFTLNHGDLHPLRNLKRLVLAGVNVEKNAFDALYNLESVHIDEDTKVSLEDIKQLSTLPKIEKLAYDPHLEQMSDAERCELVTKIAENPQLKRNTQLRISSSRQPCTCEHKIFAFLANNKQNPCYILQADCSNSQCPIISKYFSDLAFTTDYMPPREPATDYTQHDDEHRDQIKDEEDVVEPIEVHHSDGSELEDKRMEAIVMDEITSADKEPIAMTENSRVEDTNNLVTPANSAEQFKKSKFNWLPLIVILSVVAALVLIGLLVYLVRKRKDRNREFKPIPTSDSSSAKR